MTPNLKSFQKPDNFSNQDWQALETLRDAFLSSELEKHSSDYWSPRLLELYDLTFGQRIRWKIQAVLQELADLGYRPPAGASLLDWGCGTGIASRTFLKYFPEVMEVAFSDRSPTAVEFASSKFRSEFPTASITSNANEILLISHAITELNDANVASFIELANGFRTVIIIEPGTQKSSHTIISIREKLRSSFSLVAPCFHGSVCGLLNKANEENWCHFKAPVPSEVFQSPFWREYSERLHINLRSLPVSYLVLSRDFSPKRTGVRILAGSRFYKGYAQVVTCRDRGVQEEKLLERSRKKEIKKLKEESFLSTIDDE